MKYVIKLHKTTSPKARKWYYLSYKDEVVENSMAALKFNTREEAEKVASENIDFGAIVEEYTEKPLKVEEIGFDKDGKAYVKSSKTVML